MNILPKKRWHVRTKENIARVRKDEAEAAEKERIETERIQNADREARLSILKQKSKLKLQEADIVDSEQPQTSSLQHINLFQDLEHAVKTTNKEHDKETKAKKEEYEKKIGYLTYLGQDTNEALKKKNWYEVLPEESRFSRSNEIKDTFDKLVLRTEDGKPKVKEIDTKDGEVCWKTKQSLDPLNAFRKYCPEKIKLETKIPIAKNDSLKLTHHLNKNNKHNKNKDKKLQKLREARLKREMYEKRKTELFLTHLNKPSSIEDEDSNVGKVKPKYNSQFNPELARQNYW